MIMNSLRATIMRAPCKSQSNRVEISQLLGRGSILQFNTHLGFSDKNIIEEIKN